MATANTRIEEKTMERLRAAIRLRAYVTDAEWTISQALDDLLAHDTFEERHATAKAAEGSSS